jgi:hypothetical protein
MKDNWNGTCICGHLHSEHGHSGSINYTAGRCTITGCECRHFLHKESHEQPYLNKQEPDEPVAEGQFTQPFEEFADLTTFIEQMASSGMIPHGSGWTSFLYELNKICADLSTANARIQEQNLTLDMNAAEINSLRDEVETLKAKCKDLQDWHDSHV